ncbi:MAG: hypothetical protein ABI597_01790 [Gammaproteobacteria bacterium]
MITLLELLKESVYCERYSDLKEASEDAVKLYIQWKILKSKINGML